MKKRYTGISSESNFDEAMLIRMLKAGSHEAFGKLYHKYFHHLFIYCLQFTKSHHAAEDIVQEVFEKLWLNRQSINHASSVKGLLFVMARNHLTSAFRKIINSPYFEDYLNHVNTVGKEDVIAMEFEEFERKIEDAVNEMPPSRQKIFKLSRYELLTNKQIAENLNINEQSVKNSLSQSLKFLKSRIKGSMSIFLPFL